MDNQTKEQIDQLVHGEAVFLFMKGNPTFPQCGFSNQVVQILKAFEVPFGHFDVLSDPEIRQGIKDYSDWPTIPQLYVKGEFIGGSDIVKENWESGELKELLQTAFPEQKIEGPEPPAKPVNISPAQAKEMLDAGKGKFLDVRSEEERETASVEGFTLLTQKVAEDMIQTWDRETPVVFMCHFGGRSAQACEFFSQHGFREIYNVVGGIDGWSKDVDSNVPRY